MGLKTLLDFRVRLQLMLGNRGFLDADLNYWVNEGITEITSRHLFDVLRETKSGEIALGGDEATFDAPQTDEIEGILGIRNVTDEIAMARIDKARLEQLDPESEGKPKYWANIGGTIKVWPKADSIKTLSINVQIAHPQLSADGDTTILSSRWDRIVQVFAQATALSDLEEPNRAAYFVQLGDKMMAQRLERESIEGQATPAPVRPIDSFEELRGQDTVWDDIY